MIRKEKDVWIIAGCEVDVENHIDGYKVVKAEVMIDIPVMVSGDKFQEFCDLLDGLIESYRV